MVGIEELTLRGLMSGHTLDLVTTSKRIPKGIIVAESDVTMFP
jgi:hypothetical protein